MSVINIKAEMAGSIWKITVNEGDQVTEGEELLIMESMKMEIPVDTSENGKIKKINIKEGDLISEGDILVIIEV